MIIVFLVVSAFSVLTDSTTYFNLPDVSVIIGLAFYKHVYNFVQLCCLCCVGEFNIISWFTTTKLS